MAVSILYLHKDFSKEEHHGKVFQFQDMGPIMGPRPKRAQAQMGPGPKWAQGPNGPGPKWAQAQIGPGPNGPGPRAQKCETFPWWLSPTGFAKVTQ